MLKVNCLELLIPPVSHWWASSPFPSEVERSRRALLRSLWSPEVLRLPVVGLKRSLLIQVPWWITSISGSELETLTKSQSSCEIVNETRLSLHNQKTFSTDRQKSKNPTSSELLFAKSAGLQRKLCQVLTDCFQAGFCYHWCPLVVPLKENVRTSSTQKGEQIH